MSFTLIGLMFLFGAVSAKWCLDLGYSQISQMIHFIAGLFLGPLVLFILYTRLVYSKQKNGTSGSQIMGSTH